MRLLIVATLTLVAATGIQGRTYESAIVAAMTLSEARSYSWNCNITDDAQIYDIEGKTQNGFTWQRQPMPTGIARRLGRDAGHQLESIFSSPFCYVIQTGAGWRTLEELPKKHDDWNEGDWYYIPAPIIRGADMPADAANNDPFGTPTAIYIPVVPNTDHEGEKVYSNAQFALALPHEELGIIVSSHRDFKVEGDVATGMLTDIGAQLLLVHDGHEYITPIVADGRFTLWFENDSIKKYSLELVGVLIVDRKQILVRQKSTTLITAVGSTKVHVPVDARRRL